MLLRSLLAPLLVFASCAPLHGREPGARFEALAIPGEALRGNPLGDPVERRVAIFSPPGVQPSEALPIVYFLPGWGGSPDEFLEGGAGATFAQMLGELPAAGQRVRLVVVDGRTRWGGSQFVNSAATGRYADYVSDDVVRTVEGRYRVAAGQRLIAGHSSGAYGALLLAMQKPRVFAGVVALSPDSAFEVTHRGLVTQPQVRRVTRSQAEAWMPPANARPRDGLVSLVCGLCANYAPLGADQPGRFAWLYDDRGEWQPATWARWLEADPLTLIRKNRDAFAASQRIYLDGAEHDEFLANLGARSMHAVLRERASPCEFYESPGGHSDHLPARLRRGLQWVLSASEKR